MTTRQHRPTLLAALAAATLVLAACGDDDATSNTESPTTQSADTQPADTQPADTQSESTEPADTRPGESGAYPITIEVCGSKPVVIEAEPQRVITTAPNITELFLALGLGDRVIGHFGGDLPVSAFVEEYATIPKFSVEFNLEEITALEPDLIYAGFGFGFENGTVLSPDGFADKGIDALPLFGSCTYAANGEDQSAQAAAVGLQGDDLEATYADIRRLGLIFGVVDDAEALIDEMQTTVDGVQEATAGATPPTVFFYNSGDAAPFSAGGISTPNALINLAGGTNIFADLEEDYTTVSWEQVVAADPDCILVKNGSNAGNFGDDHIEFLKTSPITSGLTAVQNDCFFMLNQDHLTPGPLNAWAVQAVANWLHPELVDAPAPTR